MPPEATNILTVLERLDNLERQNRRLKRLGLGALLLVGGTLLAGFTGERPAKPAAVTETIDAQRFVLKNARGETRAQLGLLGGEFPQLTFLDAKGKTRLSLDLLLDQPSLTLFDSKGVRASLGLVLDMPVLSLHDANGKKRVWLAVPSNPVLTLYDGKEEERVSLTLLDNQPSLQVSDSAGFKAVVGTVGLATPTTGESQQTSAASVVLFGKDGKVLWRVP